VISASVTEGTDMGELQITVEGATRNFVRRDKSRVRALDNVSFEAQAGEFLVLLGPSGCGKSTLLRALAGLEQLDAGLISLGNRTVADSKRKIYVPTESRRLSMMFQSYALWPHMTVAQNVAYPLKARKIKRSEIGARVEEVLSRVGIEELAAQYPNQISGGQAQRVALARALVPKDEIVLFDEPLSNVDAKVRENLRWEIARLHRESGFTAVYVTHDQEEALTLASRICVMRQGEICQTGAPQDVYDRPNSRYVARFLGSVNELQASYSGGLCSGLCAVDSPVGRLQIDYPERKPGSLTVFSRPEAWKIHPVSSSVHATEPSFRGVIRNVVFLGSVVDVNVDVSGTEIQVRSMDRQLRPGDEVDLSIASGSLVGRADEGRTPESEIRAAEVEDEPAVSELGVSAL
jgi:iron(III) transport system ATP-binding protein